MNIASRRRQLSIAAAAGFLACGFATTARANYDRQRQSLKVETAPESRVDHACAKLVGLISTQLRARDRFTEGHGGATHRVTVACGTDKLTFKWYFKNQDASAEPVALIRVPAPDGLDTNLEALAFKVAFDVLRQLPWDGEVLSPKAGLHTLLEAVVSIGTLNSELVGTCLPIAVGRLRPGQAELFEQVGTGIIQVTGDFDSEIQYYLKRRAAPKPGEKLVLRFSQPSALTTKQREMVAACKRHNSEEDGSLVALLRNKFSVDDLMVTSNKQNLGVAYARLRADHGVTDPAIVGVYFTDQVGFGDYLTGTVDGFKDAVSKPYSQALTSSAAAPLVALVQGYALVNVTVDTYRLGLGLGVVGDKINVPYPARDAAAAAAGANTNVSVRSTKIRAGIFAAGAGVWDDLSASAETGYGLSQTSRYFGLRVSGDYRLFNTWFVGVEVRTATLGEDAATGEPGMTLTSVGFHVGFDLTK